MNAGVILAAGDSTRMGFPKQLAEVKDKPLLELVIEKVNSYFCLLYTSPSPRDKRQSRMPSSA